MEGLFTHVRHIAWGWAWLWTGVPYAAAAFRRFHRLNRRFDAIVASFNAGTLPTPGSRTPRDPASARPTTDQRPQVLSRRRGWARNLAHGGLSAFELEDILEDPDTEAAVAAVSQLNPHLHRPLLRAQREGPAWLRLPNRRPPRSPKPKRILIRLGAGQLWRGPSGIWQREEDAKKFDAKTWVYPHELEERW